MTVTIAVFASQTCLQPVSVMWNRPSFLYAQRGRLHADGALHHFFRPEVHVMGTYEQPHIDVVHT